VKQLQALTGSERTGGDMKFFKSLFSCISVSKYLAELRRIVSKKKNIYNSCVNFAEKLIFKNFRSRKKLERSNNKPRTTIQDRKRICKLASKSTVKALIVKVEEQIMFEELQKSSSKIN